MAWLFSGQGVGLATPEVAGSTPAVPLSANNLGQFVRTHVPLSPSSTIWYWSVIWYWQRCPAAGKVTVGLTSHRLQWFIYLRARERKGDEPTLLMEYGILYFFTCL